MQGRFRSHALPQNTRCASFSFDRLSQQSQGPYLPYLAPKTTVSQRHSDHGYNGEQSTRLSSYRRTRPGGHAEQKK